MMLSKKELEVMNILWGSKYSLTATDIVDASSLTERSWKEKSIYIILRALVDKNVIARQTKSHSNQQRQGLFAVNNTGGLRCYARQKPKWS